MPPVHVFSSSALTLCFGVAGKDHTFDGNGNGLLFHVTQPTSRSTIKAIECSKPTISEH